MDNFEKEQQRSVFKNLHTVLKDNDNIMNNYIKEALQNLVRVQFQRIQKTTTLAKKLPSQCHPLLHNLLALEIATGEIIEEIQQSSVSALIAHVHHINFKVRDLIEIWQQQMDPDPPSYDEIDHPTVTTL